MKTELCQEPTCRKLGEIIYVHRHSEKRVAFSVTSRTHKE